MPHDPPPPERGVYCNRTLNMRGIRAIGYDMDYTLVHYRIEEWELRAYQYLQTKLSDLGWPVGDLEFDPKLVVRGLIIDLDTGNVLKANRFGYVKRAFHGTRPLPFEDQRRLYGRILVDLNEDRWVFLNTLFAISEGSMYAQLIDLLDAGEIPGVLGYGDLYRIVRTSIDEAHVEGQLKAEVIKTPERFVELDEEVAAALLDQRAAGKKLLLISNSEWEYVRSIMAYAFDRYLPEGMGWRDLFDVVIVAARKPTFFYHRNPVFAVTDDEGLLRPSPMGITEPGVFLGGHAGMVESFLGLSGDEILYVGDHIYTDVHVSKDVLRWRTALVLRELEAELAEMRRFQNDQVRLGDLMRQKEALEFRSCQLRLGLQRKKANDPKAPAAPQKQLDKELNGIRTKLNRLDEGIAPLASASATLSNERWGLLMRAGNDKSHLARQVETYADIYTSRVSNFLFQTPYVYFRAPRGTLPHDATVVSGVEEEQE